MLTRNIFHTFFGVFSIEFEQVIVWWIASKVCVNQDLQKCGIEKLSIRDDFTHSFGIVIGEMIIWEKTGGLVEN